MKLLITGSNGLLGQKLVSFCLANEILFVATSKGENRNPDCPNEMYLELDITNKENVDEMFNAENPTHVAHTAALTNVDFCELNPEECELVNVTATQYLIEATNTIGAHFQFVSTDFVFDGEQGDYKEEDKVNPLSVYATSKVRGENLVQSLCVSEWSIVRTIIVYGIGHNLSRSNLIVWAKGALENGDSINIIDDQFRAPTYADDLAAGCMGVVLCKRQGIFHISGPETLSIYGIVERIAKHYKYSMDNVNKISSSTLDQPAKRPPRTGFDLSKAYAEIDYKPRTIEESLDLIF
ncbi:MAG: NAD(P)-dependent oxidoreductase [Crocinitomicaceae bacterium]|nr:NAD(P)-dependent oxidoreductase [Crocinitomicaceae bacterium]